MSYAERIRHPSEALESAAPSEQKTPGFWERHPGAVLLFYVALAALVIYGFWRANAIQKAAAALGAVVENPFGWV